MKSYDKVNISMPTTMKDYIRDKSKPRNFSKRLLSAFLILACLILYAWQFLRSPSTASAAILAYRSELLAHCRSLHAPFSSQHRTQSDRYVPGTPPVLIRDAKIWTGARNGTEIVFGDVLLHSGLVRALGVLSPDLKSLLTREEKQRVVVVDAKGAWVTPGLVDLHSHIGVSSAPGLRGSADGNSRKDPIQPWLRSIDGLNTHDASYELAIAGGVTTAQVLPGSANNIGGQSFVIKLRPTAERSSISRVVEPPYTLIPGANGSSESENGWRWRHMKHACGENPDRVYSQTRMDAAWNFRHAYDQARKLKEKEDTVCALAQRGDWKALASHEYNKATSVEGEESELKWESLVDVLRGRVKLSIHCYEAVDLDAIVRLSNEFKFPVGSFHHAGETYLVPELLKKTWGGAPAIALFASNFRKKREAYRGSEFAPRILAAHGIPVVMKSDHPVLNSRYLLYEAQQAHYYGLNPALALASVTSTPAQAAGLGHRVGTISEGYDADIVIWDSHPLALGATPKQVYIDGVAQLSNPYTLSKPASFQRQPVTPNFDKEAEETVKYAGLPPLEGRRAKGPVKFVNVRSMYVRESSGVGVRALFDKVWDKNEGDKGEDVEDSLGTVVIRDGIVSCIDDGSGTGACDITADENKSDGIEVVDLEGGSLSPGLMSFGSPLGLVEIRLEPSTNDGDVYDPLEDDLPSVISNSGEYSSIHAADGLQFGGRNTLLAYRAGVTTAITAPTGSGLFKGFSAAFATGANSSLEDGAVLSRQTALHVAVARGNKASVSTQVAVLRKLLFGEESYKDWEPVRQGIIPLVVHVNSADIMATLIQLKSEYETSSYGRSLRLTFAGAIEAHLLAAEIANAGISVILTPSRPFPRVWDQRRILPGPPLSYDSAITALTAAGVNVAIGVVDEAEARNTRFDIAWAALESNGRIDKIQAIALATANLERALGLDSSFALDERSDLVVYRGGDALGIQSKVVGVVSTRRGLVDLF